METVHEASYDMNLESYDAAEIVSIAWDQPEVLDCTVASAEKLLASAG